jgi:RHS repeat-associated protein
LGAGTTSVEELYYNREGDHIRSWYARGHYRTYERDYAARTVVETLHAAGNRRQRTTTFDALGHLISSTGPHGLECRTEHDSGDRLTRSYIRRSGIEICDVSLDYGSSSRLNGFTVRHAGASHHTDFSYDPDLNISVAADSLISEAGYIMEYGPAGLRSKLVRPFTVNAHSTFGYHSNGGIARIEHRIGDGWSNRYRIDIEAADYDLQGNPLVVTHRHLEPDGDPAGNDAFLQAERHSYDEAGRVTSSVYDGIDEEYINEETQLSREFHYDAKSRKLVELVRVVPDRANPTQRHFEIVKLSYGAGEAPLQEEREWYEVGGTTPRFRCTRYRYDAFGRRTHAIETLEHERDEPDERWARLTEYRYGLNNQPEQVLVYELWESDVVLITDTTFGYDPYDRLIYSSHKDYQESRFGSEEASPSLRERFADFVDFASNRLRAPEFTSDTVRYYVHAEQNLVAILDGERKPLQEFLVGAGVNSRLAVRARVDEEEYETYTYLLDHRGNVLATLEASGEIKEAVRQSGTWGEFSARRNEVTSAGNWQDATGLTQAGARKYDPTIGQFIAPDRIGGDPIESRYVFASANPIVATDVDGRLLIPVLVGLGLGLWTYSEITGWYGGSLSGDPTWGSSPTLGITQGLLGKSVFGGPGNNHPRLYFESTGERSWMVFIGAISILGAVLPVFSSFRVLTAAGNLTNYGRLLALDGGLSLVGGAGELYRGNALSGGLMIFGSMTGLLWLQAGAAAGSAARRVPVGYPEKYLVQALAHNNAGRLPGIDPEIAPAARLVRNQHEELGSRACAISSFAMILDAYGIATNLAIQSAIGRLAFFCQQSGTFPRLLHNVVTLLLPNARFWERGTLTVRQLQRAVMNGHPVHLNVFRPGYPIGHSVVVDGLERTWLGTVKHFLVRDPDVSVDVLYPRQVPPSWLVRDLRVAEAITTHPTSWLTRL